uniref:Poor Imd response upon knock-in n=2 Tax=Bombyx mori TaxID=7091 RepID=A0A8R1WIM9_BOMMO|nr:uncharacterized protein LOC101738894 [Bombyx mori]
MCSNLNFNLKIVVKLLCCNLLFIPLVNMDNNNNFVGNNTKVTMETNSSLLKVVGNNCVIYVRTNYGDIEVVGNNCRVEVTNNYGIIHVVGANSLVNINKRWRGDSVQLLGANCRLIVAGKLMSAPSYEAQLSPSSTDLDDVIEPIFPFVMR